jgi:hypothetical protein
MCSACVPSICCCCFMLTFALLLLYGVHSPACRARLGIVIVLACSLAPAFFSHVLLFSCLRVLLLASCCFSRPVCLSSCSCVVVTRACYCCSCFGALLPLLCLRCSHTCSSCCVVFASFTVVCSRLLLCRLCSRLLSMTCCACIRRCRAHVCCVVVASASAPMLCSAATALSCLRLLQYRASVLCSRRVSAAVPRSCSRLTQLCDGITFPCTAVVRMSCLARMLP